MPVELDISRRWVLHKEGIAAVTRRWFLGSIINFQFFEMKPNSTKVANTFLEKLLALYLSRYVFCFCFVFVFFFGDIHYIRWMLTIILQSFHFFSIIIILWILFEEGAVVLMWNNFSAEFGQAVVEFDFECRVSSALFTQLFLSHVHFGLEQIVALFQRVESVVVET